MDVTITLFYAALASLIYLALTARVIVYRRSKMISLGEHGDKQPAQTHPNPSEPGGMRTYRTARAAHG